MFQINWNVCLFSDRTISEHDIRIHSDTIIKRRFYLSAIYILASVLYHKMKYIWLIPIFFPLIMALPYLVSN